MTQCNLVFLLEEKSAKAMLSGVLQRISPDTDSKFFTFEGKEDLINEIKNKIQKWLYDNYDGEIEEAPTGNYIFENEMMKVIEVKL